MTTRFTVFDSGVTSDEVLHWLGDDTKVDLACHDASCAPPPAGTGGSRKGPSGAAKVLEAVRSQGGATLDTKRNMRPVTSGYVVAEQPKRSEAVHVKDLTTEHIDSFLQRNAAELARPGNKFGVWHDTQTGQVWMDVVRVYPSTSAGKAKAVAAGQKHNQIAIFHLDSGKEIDTGGTGVAAALLSALVSAGNVPPQEVRDAARRGLALREKYGRGGTNIGAGRATDLSNGRSISDDTIRRMVSYFARHEVDKQGKGWAPGSEGHPSAGYIAWLLWGGEPGRRWANTINNENTARTASALVAACRSKACAPPPVGTGGSDKGGIKTYEVGGAVRDEIMGIPSNDIDHTVVAPSYEAMKQHLVDQGFKIFQENPEHLTIRARPPEGHPLLERTSSADYVLARKDSPTGDGRRPDFVEPGTLHEDLARRDFTVNAIAKDSKGNLIDPHGGQADIANRTLRFVGDPMTRVKEDGLRVLRGFRFMVTKGLTAEPETWKALTSPDAAKMLGKVSKERVANELTKMFDHDTQGSLKLLASLPDETLKAIFPTGVRLTPTMKKRKAA